MSECKNCTRAAERAAQDTQLMRKLADALKFVRALVDEQDCFECRGDEDCDHCLAIYHVIDPALELVNGASRQEGDK